MSKKKNNGGVKKESAAGQKDEAKKDVTVVVLKVDTHCYCEGCTEKVIKAVNGFKGVASVKPDVKSGKLTVAGKVDPWKLRDHVEKKTNRKVELVSPTKKPDEKKPVDKQTKEIKASTVVLKIPLHCQGCIDKIRKTISNIKGVDNVDIDANKDLVTVKGTMDAKALPGVLKEKLKKLEVEVVQPKKDDGSKKKKKEADGEGGAGEEAENKKNYAAMMAAAAAMAEANRMQYLHGMMQQQDYNYGMYGYRTQMPHPPQLFSDENPNAACSIM